MPTREQLFQFAQEAESMGDLDAAERALDMIHKLPATAHGESNPALEKGVMSPFAEKRAKKFDVGTDPKKYIWQKLLGGFSSGTGGTIGLLSDIEKSPGRFLAKMGVPIFDKYANQDYLQGTKTWTEATDKVLGVDRTMKPTDESTQYLGSVAEFGGASVVPSGAVIASAKKTIPAVASEAAANVTGGVTAEFGADVAEEAGMNSGVGAIPLGITGSTAGYALPAVGTKVASGKNKFDTATKNKAGKELHGMISAEGLQHKIDDSFLTADAITDVTGKPFDPTLAGRTQSSYIEKLETSVLGRNTEAAEKASSTYKSNLETLAEFTDAVLPESSKSIQRIAGERASRATRNVDEAAEVLAAKRAAIGKEYKAADQQKIGEEIKERLSKTAKAAKKKSDDEIQDIYRIAEKNKVKANMDDVSASVRKMIGKDENVFQNMPPIFSEVLGKYKKVQGERKSQLVDPSGNLLSKLPDAKSPPATFKEIHSLYKETNRLLRKEDTGFTSAQMHFLGELKESLDKKMATFAGEKAGGVGGKLSKWNAEYTNYVNTFRKDAAGAVLKKRKEGDLAPSKIVKTFFNPEGVDQFKKLYGKDPSTMQMLEDGVVDMFVKNSGISTKGYIDPKRAALWLDKHKSTLNKLPELQKKLVGGGVATKVILDKAARLNSAKKAISNGILMQVAKTPDIAPLIEKALIDPSRKTLRALSTTGEEGRKAVVHAIASAIPEVAKSKGMTITKFLEKYDGNIKPLLDRYGKEHYKNVKIVMKGMDMVTHGKPPTHPNLTKYNVDTVKELTGTSVPSLASQIRTSALYGFVSPVHVGFSLGANFWRKLKGDGAGKLQEYLLTNPKAARDFALATKAKDTNVFGNKIRNHLYAAGVRSTVAGVDYEDEDK